MLSDYTFKGTPSPKSIKHILAAKRKVSRDLLTLVFFIKHLLLVPLDTPRKDIKFVQIFKELFAFVIDSPVYSLPEGQTPRCIHVRGFVTPQCIHHRGVATLQCIHLRGVDLDWFTIEPASAKYTR